MRDTYLVSIDKGNPQLPYLVHIKDGMKKVGNFSTVEFVDIQRSWMHQMQQYHYYLVRGSLRIVGNACTIDGGLLAR